MSILLDLNPYNMRYRNGYIFVIASSALLLIILLHLGISLQPNSIRLVSFLPQTVEGVFQEKFVYLVQTEQCLPNLLMQNEYFLNTSECHCDVIVYSYEENCTNNQYKHIEYLFETNNRTTWNAGRNLLYSIAKERRIPYLYYIFMDDDIELFYNKNISQELVFISPLRYFENFLMSRRPGIGVADLLNYYGSKFILEKIGSNCNVGENQTSLPSNRTTSSSMFLTAVHFDALFNAFHRDIVDTVLPYIVDYDDIDWTLSQRYVISLIELKFRGEVVMFTPVAIRNVLHREYPVNTVSVFDTWRHMTKEIVSTMPKKYQDAVNVKQHIDNPIDYTDNSDTICFMLPPLRSFEMYSYLSLNWSVD